VPGAAWDNLVVRRPFVRFVAPAVAAGAVLTLLGGPVSSAGAGRPAFRPCPGERSVLCARVSVPLDRSGGVPGRVRLLVARVKGNPRRRGVLVGLAGGPGQASTPLLEAFAEAAEPALRSRELVVFDQRGTGGSGLLRCPSVERRYVRDLVSAGAACAARLGRRRAFYTTRDSIADLEAVRMALGVERIALLGVSYGTKVALGYAAAHPERVDRLVLDSTVAADGPDVYSRSSFAAVPEVLRDACRARRCRGITADPAVDLAALASRLRAGPLRGSVVGRHGERRPAVLRTGGLLRLLFASDVDPTLLPSLPAAVRSAGRGDAAPILRLSRAAAASEDPGDPREFSSGVLAATLCEESAFPWSRTAVPEQRRHELGAALQALGDGPFAPFERTAPIGLFAMPVCYAWPAAAAPPVFPTAPLPAAPTLLLSGTRDLRTPVGDARDLAARMPDARVLAMRGGGHSVLSSTETRCPSLALGAFFAGRPVRQECPRDRGAELPTEPVAPVALREVAPVPGVGGLRGRTVNAVLRTVGDGVLAILAPLSEALLDPFGAPQELAVGGLRAGWVRLEENGLEFHRSTYVPGVTVTGRLRLVLHGTGVRGRLRVGGPAAARGAMVLRPSGLVTGRLGGRRVRARMPYSWASTAGGPPAGAHLRALRAWMRPGRPRISGPRLPGGAWSARAG
jgi:pimeloyl-ACP methyl ester carboxylesterase